MIDGLIRGKLIKAPESRATKAGRPYATARLRVPTSNPAETLFASVVAFGPEAVAALLALGEGDAVSVAGSLKVGTWTDKEGNARPSLDLVADRVLSVYAIRKQRAAAGGGQPAHVPSSVVWV
ncbi:single-stranded DNA-binding protein [Macromonas bipunctata]|uniref:single-stranded DNA-binding protein n=1 Tax=Macromonas bipunctata TaxID=183670 RepID=UPI000C334716|nr:single-stranded DNA-binding protein [Macromonas bipunctata]